MINRAPAPSAGIEQSIYVAADENTTPLSPIDRIKAIQNKTALHQALLEDHKNFTRYPTYNQAIASATQDPTERRYDIDERSTRSKEGDSSLTIWSDKKYYLHGDQVQIFATLRDAEGTPMTSKFMGQLIYNERTSLQVIEFADEDKDGTYQHTLTLSQQEAFPPGLYKVLIVNNTNEISDALTFTLSQPEITLTGNYRDSVSAGGELLIQAEVTVTAKNRFYFQASLYSANNDPIGATQHATELTQGKHWVPLTFDGKLIQDAGESGPFVLKSLSLAKVVLPIQRAPIMHPEFYTKDYSLEQFTQGTQAEKDVL